MVRYRSSDILNRVVVLRGRGLLQCEIAQILGMSQGAVSKVLKRNRVLGTPVPRPRPGRYRKTTRRDDRLLLRLCRRNRWNNSTQLRQEWVRATGRPVTTSTVRKRLVRAGYRARRPARCPALTERHRLHRRQWAQRHRNWALGHWRHVVFADESRFTLHRNDGRLSVRRMAGERLLGTCVAPNHGTRRPSIMVWGAIHHGEKSPILVIDGNLRQDGYIARHTFRDNFVFVHDNAPPHVSNITRAFMVAEGLEVMHWPAKSPDMNPIEHVWDQMSVILRDSDNPPTNLAELRAAVLQAWDRLTIQRVANLIESMPRRVRALQAAAGGYTRY